MTLEIPLGCMKVDDQSGAANAVRMVGIKPHTCRLVIIIHDDVGVVPCLSAGFSIVTYPSALLAVRPGLGDVSDANCVPSGGELQVSRLLSAACALVDRKGLVRARLDDEIIVAVVGKELTNKVCLLIESKNLGSNTFRGIKASVDAYCDTNYGVTVIRLCRKIGLDEADSGDSSAEQGSNIEDAGHDSELREFR